MLRHHFAIGFVTAGVVAVSASAGVITNGFTFSVADAFGGPSGVGTHFHSSTGGDFGNPAGLAEVGELGDEETRGLSEYNLAGLLAGPAFVSFDVFQLGGLFGQANYIGLIDVYAYVGNNAENLSDFEAAPVAFIGSFSTLGLSVGNQLSLNVTTVYNNFLANNEASLGIRLQAAGGTNDTAIVFNDFRLTTEPVPAPAAAALLALAGAAHRRRRR